MSERYITHHVTDHCAIQGPQSQVLAQVSRKPAGDLIERLERICQHKFASRDMLIHDCALGHITLGDIADLCAAVRTSDFSLAAQINDLEDQLNAEVERVARAEAQLAAVKQSLTTGDLVSREAVAEREIERIAKLIYRNMLWAADNGYLKRHADAWERDGNIKAKKEALATASLIFTNSLPAAPAVKVKPLVWDGFTSGSYRIEIEKGGIARLQYYSAAIYEDECPEEILGGYLTLVSMDDLKAAAQSHHEAHILAALEGGEA